MSIKVIIKLTIVIAVQLKILANFVDLAVEHDDSVRVIRISALYSVWFALRLTAWKR